MSEHKNVQHLASKIRQGFAECGVQLGSDVTGSAVTCPDCWAARRGKGEPGIQAGATGKVQLA